MKNNSKTDTGSCVKLQSFGVFLSYPLQTSGRARVILTGDVRSLPQSIQ